jgi:hypothetical protein
LRLARRSRRRWHATVVIARDVLVAQLLRLVARDDLFAAIIDS